MPLFLASPSDGGVREVALDRVDETRRQILIYSVLLAPIGVFALVLPLSSFRKRSPLWLQRLRAADVLRVAQQIGCVRASQQATLDQAPAQG